MTIGFDAPTADEMARAGLNPEGSRQILAAPWWDEMVADVVETPEMCDPADPPEQVLRYARDVRTSHCSSTTSSECIAARMGDRGSMCLPKS